MPGIPDFNPNSPFDSNQEEDLGSKPEGLGNSNIQQHLEQAQTSHAEDQQPQQADLHALGYSELEQHHPQEAHDEEPVYKPNPVFAHFGNGYDPHPKDTGMHFYVGNQESPDIGIYRGQAASGKHTFEVSGRQQEFDRSQIHGYKARVGGLHPPGQNRSSYDKMRGRTDIEISGGDLSRTMAKIRSDNQRAQAAGQSISDVPQRMAVTTFDRTKARPDKDSPDYERFPQNAENARRLGVQVEQDVNVKDSERLSFLGGAAPNANIHAQMPRVPQGTKGYSTQQLTADIMKIPGQVGLPRATTSITTPDPANFKTHNRTYGLEKAAEGAGMQQAGAHADDRLQDFGYNHKQTTKDETTDSAARRMTYHFEPGESTSSEASPIASSSKRPIEEEESSDEEPLAKKQKNHN